MLLRCCKCCCLMMCCGILKVSFHFSDVFLDVSDIFI